MGNRKHEDWLSRGVKNVIGLKRPVPYEVELQNTDWFINLVAKFNQGTLNLITNTLEKEQMLKQMVLAMICYKTVASRFQSCVNPCIGASRKIPTH